MNKQIRRLTIVVLSLALIFCIASAAFAITHATNCSKHRRVVASTEQKRENVVQDGMKCIQMYARDQYEDTCFDANGKFLKLQYSMGSWRKVNGVVCPK